jgi:small GTP-binding protein
MNENKDIQFKMILIGNAKVGKSCFLHYFVTRRFKSSSKTTLGVEFGSQVIEVGDKAVNLRVWDTAGDERFRSITRSYYRNAVGVLIFYDITSRQSYEQVPQWIEDARQFAENNAVLMLVGNKSDLLEDEEEGGGDGGGGGSDDDDENGAVSLRQVPMLEASAFAQENNLLFLETSAKTGSNVLHAFILSGRNILEKVERGELNCSGLEEKKIAGGWDKPADGKEGGCAC